MLQVIACQTFQQETLRTENMYSCACNNWEKTIIPMTPDSQVSTSWWAAKGTLNRKGDWTHSSHLLRCLGPTWESLSSTSSSGSNYSFFPVQILEAAMVTQIIGSFPLTGGDVDEVPGSQPSPISDIADI